MISNYFIDITPYFCLICWTQINYRKLWLARSKIVYYKVIKICGNSVIQTKLPPKRFKAERLNNFNHRASTLDSVIFQSANEYGCHAILHACFVLSFRFSTILIGRTRRLQLTFSFHKGVYYEYGTRSEIICVQTGEDNGVTNALTVLCHGVGRKLKDVVIFTPR